MLRHFAAMLTPLFLAAFASAQEPPAADTFQADPELLLSARQGPYMIYVCSFRGDNAGPLAQDLARELRTQHKLSAFLLRRVDEDAAADRDRIRQEQMQKPGGSLRAGRKVRVLEDWAVLVGNYRDLDAAAADLKRIKQVEKPRNLNIFNELQVLSNPLAERSRSGKTAESQKLQETRIETFRKAFATRNPLAPKAAVAKGEDASKLQALNQYEKRSLSRCKAPYTLVVMEFRGPVDVSEDKPSIFDQKAFAGSRSPYGPDKNHLEHAVLLAERLADQLSDNGKGYEAYLLHTSRSTMVTIGGFQSQDDPELKKAMQALAGQNVGGIQLLKNPYPCQVPKL